MSVKRWARRGALGHSDTACIAPFPAEHCDWQVWYHSNCSNRGKGCYNTRLTDEGGCCIWYNEPAVGHLHCIIFWFAIQSAVWRGGVSCYTPPHLWNVEFLQVLMFFFCLVFGKKNLSISFIVLKTELPNFCVWRVDVSDLYVTNLYGHIKTVEQRTIIQQYGEEGPGQAGAPPSPHLAVPNVTSHPSTASVPTYYLMWHYNCLRTIKG